MALHSKGKHSAKKAAFKSKPNRARLKAEAAKAAQAEEASELEDAASDASAKRASAKGSSGAPKHVRKDADEKPDAGADAVKSSEEGDADPASVDAAEKESAYKPSFEWMNPPKKKQRLPRRQLLKRWGIACAIVAGVVGATYLGGVALFATHYYPNTSIASLDLSFDSPSTAVEELDDQVGSYTMHVKGHGMNLKITSEDASMALDSEKVADSIMESQDPWIWPAEAFYVHDMTAIAADSISATTLSDVLTTAVASVNERMEAPVDASVIFDEETAKFQISPEVPGTMPNPDLVMERTLAGLLNLDTDIVLTNDTLITPQVYRDDKRLVDACNQANQLARADITFTLDGIPAASINASTIGAWVTITPEFEVLFNDDELTMWAEDIGERFNTVGSERTYVRPDGKEVTVSGGSYGWKVDGEELEAAAIDAVRNGTIGQVEIPVLQSGSGFTSLGSQDWGLRYVDVDLSEQYARFYDNGGSLIWESDIVSGAKGKTDSPTGVYSLNHKQSPTVLIGEMTSDGTPEYESKVNYWMPFKGNSVGLHDATWQSAFGGSRYASGYGSHGCINLPLSAAEELYSIIVPGDVVVVHY